MPWHSDVYCVNAQRGNGRNKIKFYRLFKTSFHVEPNCMLVLNRSQRGTIATFRSGTAQIRDIIMFCKRIENVQSVTLL
jgi:hypothetical protein